MKYTIAISCVLLLVSCDSNTTTVESYDDCVLSYSKGVTALQILETIKTSCKQKNPKKFDFAEIAKSANVKSWPEVLVQKEYQSQTDAVKEQIKDEYFVDVIKSRVHPDFISEAKIQFDSYSRGVKVSSAENSSANEKTTTLGKKAQQDTPLPLEAKHAPRWNKFLQGFYGGCLAKQRKSPSPFSDAQIQKYCQCMTDKQAAKGVDASSSEETTGRIINESHGVCLASIQ